MNLESFSQSVQQPPEALPQPQLADPRPFGVPTVMRAGGSQCITHRIQCFFMGPPRHPSLTLLSVVRMLGTGQKSGHKAATPKGHTQGKNFCLGEQCGQRCSIIFSTTCWCSLNMKCIRKKAHVLKAWFPSGALRNDWIIGR
jgi:hypothetical protein